MTPVRQDRRKLIVDQEKADAATKKPATDEKCDRVGPAPIHA
ncbi:MAG TPA: hypothetical protein VJP89_05435 [Pyrinomonadaceae bacterium]|nr:hypothetical protein [Pyrinomonadaceae bacterium]